MLSIAFFGECMVEVSGTLPSPLQLGFAGDTFNTAAYFSRLLKSKGNIEYLTGLGSDLLSDKMRGFLEKSGVGTKYIRTIPNRRPGLYLIEIADNGERTFHYWRGEAAAKFLLDELPPAAFATELMQFEAVYLSGISIAILTERGKKTLHDALCLAKSQGLKIYFDTNYRPLLWQSRNEAKAYFEKFVPLADIAMVTDSDMTQLYDIHRAKAEELLFNFNVPEIVLKSGDQPCIILTRRDRICVPACRVENVVDTTAAGDSFNAAYLAARLTGCSPGQAAVCGHQLAAKVIQQHGAIISEEAMPILDFLSTT